MSDDAEVARLMRSMAGGGAKPAAKADAGGPISPRGGPVSPRGSKPAEVEENLEGMSAEEARLLKSMHTGKGHAPAKKWADPVQQAGPISPRGAAPTQAAPAQAAAAPAPAPVVHHQEPEVHRHPRPAPEEEALVEVVADPEALRQKEEEQAAKEAARMERMLAKKFIH